MLKAWMRVEKFTLHNLIPSALVVVRKPKGDSHPPQAINAQGISHLTCRLSSARFSYIPASGGSGMQISPPDTVIKQLLGVVLRQGWRGGRSHTRPQSNVGRMMLTDRPTAHASPLALGVRGDSTYSLSLALRKTNGHYLDRQGNRRVR